MSDVVFDWQGVSVNQGPSKGTDYPFARPSDDIRFLLGDFWLSFEAGTDFTPPLRVAWMAGFGTNAVSNPAPDYTLTHTVDMLILDAVGLVVFDSTLAATFTATPWGNHLVTYQWIGEEGVLRCTRHTAPPTWAATRTAATYDNYIVPERGWLSSRAYARLPRRVRSIRTGVTTLTDRVQLAAGYNINLGRDDATPVEGQRAARRVVVRANPGDGLGRAPGCAKFIVPELRRVNGVGPTPGGDLILDIGDCYRAQRPATATMRLFNDCAPCCDCNGYIRTYAGLQRVWNRYADQGKRAEDVRDQHQLNIDRWDAQKACRQASPLKLIVSAEPGCRLFVGGLLCNAFDGCIENLTLSLAFTGGITGTPLCRESYRSGSITNFQEEAYTPIPTGMTYLDFVFERVEPGTVARFRTRLDASPCPSDPGATAGGYIDLNVIGGGDARLVDAEGATMPWPTIDFVRTFAEIGKRSGCATCAEKS